MSDEPTGALSVNGFCATYSVGRSLFYEELKAGRIVVRKLGKKTLILKSDAERWAQSLPKLETH
jgi:hypothetical protein